MKPSFLFVGKNFNDARQFYTALLLNLTKKLKTGNKNITKEATSSNKVVDEEGFELVTKNRKKR